MRESLIVLDTHSGEAQEGARFPLGDLKGKNEAWLRDTLFKYPQIIPINDIDSTFGPLVPLCVEMHTSRDVSMPCTSTSTADLPLSSASCGRIRSPGARSSRSP